MPAELLALLSALTYAVSDVLVRYGIRGSTPWTAVLISIAINVLALGTATLLAHPLGLLQHWAILFFVSAGLFTPGGARILFYTGIARVGVAIASPLRESTPLFSALLAVVLLGETLTVPIISGTLLILSGIYTLGALGSVQPSFRKRDLLYPLGAAGLSAISYVLRRAGLLHLNAPLLGAAVSSLTALVALGLFTRVVPSSRDRIVVSPRAVVAFILSGLCTSLAVFLNFSALSRGQVVVVVPLMSTAPLFALLFSALFLRRLEAIMPRTIVGAILLLSGAVLLTVFRVRH
ncbi:MAG: DMT family transporter [Deltaproteobacteria bacterium]|nr:DMT family transporter [Deltaproteobacteria bacterium]MBI3076923.1 DMT family transporter [Deltaproteobacteria bacterium]